jgi:hypothetical protein
VGSSDGSGQEINRKVGWKKSRKRGENEFFPNVGIVNYGFKSLFFERGVSKLFILPRNTGFFERSFFRGEGQWLVAGGQWSAEAAIVFVGKF